MATYTFYADTADAALYSFNVNPVLARAGSGVTILDASGDSIVTFGQDFSGGSYYVYEAFISFDTSSVVGTVTSATLALYISNDQSATDFTMTAAVYDWGASVTTGDFVSAATLGTLSTRASLGTSGVTSGAYNSFTSDASFVSNAVGTIRFVLFSDRSPAGLDSTTREYVSAHSGNGANPPRLTITTAAVAPPPRRPRGLYVR